MQRYVFDDASYDALNAHGVDWRTVLYVLHEAHPCLRQRIGSVLRVAAMAPDGQLVGVTTMEQHDDEYLVVTARVLEGHEREAVLKMLNGGRR